MLLIPQQQQSLNVRRNLKNHAKTNPTAPNGGHHFDSKLAFMGTAGPERFYCSYHHRTRSSYSEPYSRNCLLGIQKSYYIKGVFHGWYEYRRWRTYEIFTFEKGGNTFEVSLNKNDSGFNISDITNQSEGSTTGYMFGDYQVRADTIILTDIYSKEKCFIHRNRIYDFQGKDKSFLLRKK